MAAKKNLTGHFEKSLQELETVVTALEQGELSLEDALKRFERGVELTRLCQTALHQAEQKVEQLVAKDGQLSLEPFEQQE